MEHQIGIRSETGNYTAGKRDGWVAYCTCGWEGQNFATHREAEVNAQQHTMKGTS